jgi:hypothetical protein
MNSFQNVSDFIEKDSTANLYDSFKELLEQARSIRRCLGERAYLIDNYLSYMFEATGKLQEFVSNGLDDSMELRGICRNIISQTGNYSSHPFYTHAKAYIESHPHQFCEFSTKEALYVIALTHDFLEYKVNLLIKKEEKALSEIIDIIEIKELFYRISGLLGNNDAMRRINKLFCQRFLVITPTASFIQGLTSDLIFSMGERDRETSRQLFQIILDQEDM